MFPVEMAALELWTYGEDSLAEAALAIPQRDLSILWKIAEDYWESADGLPLQAPLTLDKVTALAAITYLEGQVRPLAQEHPRPVDEMPDHLAAALWRPSGPHLDPASYPLEPSSEE
jgi:hypothetical protein